MYAFYATKISEHLSKTPEGYLVCTSTPVARVGFQPYIASEIGLPGNDVVNVWRDPSQVFDPATIASFEGKAVCEGHPPETVTATNHSAYDKGHVQNVRRSVLEDGTEALVADLVITDPNLIQKIDNGLRELSCGYSCTYQPIEGQPNAYQQINIRGNHVAVVPNGRAGAEIRIRDEQPEALMETTPKTFLSESKIFIDAFSDMMKTKGYTLDIQPAAIAEQPALAATQAVDQTTAPVAAKTKERKYRPMSKQQNNDGLLARIFGIGFKEFAKDAEPEEVAEAAKLAQKAEERSDKARDEEPKAETKTESGAGPKGLGEQLSVVKDALESHGKMMIDHGTTMKDSMQKMCDSMEGLKGMLSGKSEEKKESEDADFIKEGAEEPKEEKKATDGDLIPDPEVVPAGDLPKNPVADAALVETLRALRPVIAATKDKQAIDNFNSALRSAKGYSPVAAGTPGYGAFTKTKKPKAVVDADRNEKQNNVSQMTGPESPELRQGFYKNLQASLGKNLPVVSKTEVN